MDLIDVKIAELRKNCLFLRIKSVDEDLEGHHIFSDRPSIDKEVTSLAKKYLEDEELAEFATKELLPALEKNEIECKGYDYDTVNFENGEIPEIANSLDFITSNSVIEHLNDATNLLEEAFRILKPGGKLILITPNFFYDYKNFYDDPTHVNPFTVEKLETMLEMSGFKNINVLPWIVMKSPSLWKIPFSFFFARYCLIARNDTRLPIPKFLRGQTKVMFSIAEIST